MIPELKSSDASLLYNDATAIKSILVSNQLLFFIVRSVYEGINILEID